MITNRFFMPTVLKAGAAGFLALSLTGAGYDRNFPKKEGVSTENISEDVSKPTIIFLMTDQQRWDAIGINNPHIKTPNLDRLAQQGILFNQATYKNPILNADYPDVDVEQLGRCRLV
jgi:hypothetical protein